VGLQDVIRDEEDGVTDGDGDAFLAASGGQGAIARTQGGVFGTSRRVGRLTKDARSQREPLRVFPLLRLPALS